MKIILGKGDIFFPLYSYFKNQPFPIVSTTIQKKIHQKTIKHMKRKF